MMVKRVALPQKEREYIQRVINIVYSNPFADAPPDFNELLDERGAATTESNHYYYHLFPAISHRLQKLSAMGISSIKDVVPEDSQLLKSAFLFEIYCLYLDDFDDLIDRQLLHGDQPVDAPFITGILKQLKMRGINQNESYRYLAFFYQVRRAFRFIDRGLTGSSSVMRQLRFKLWNNVFTVDTELFMYNLWDQLENFTTLLLGATGTGKGTAAAAIGQSGHIPFDPSSGMFKKSFTSMFSSINLSQFPENLIESELFGHRKGAFTGAIDQHKGVFERCLAHGTLFLDEIGDVSIPIQIKLLNILQDRLFTPVGSHEIKRFNGRIISATNHSLNDMIKTGQFREDFYYRLTSDVIHMPPLQQRLEESPDELELLVKDLVVKMLGRDNPMIIDRVMSTLQPHIKSHYSWPGNVRELNQAIRRIILTGEYDLQNVQENTNQGRLPEWLQLAAAGVLSNDQLLSHYYKLLYTQMGESYQAVAQRAGVDWRTVKKWVESD